MFSGLLMRKNGVTGLVIALYGEQGGKRLMNAILQDLTPFSILSGIFRVNF